MCEHGLLVGVFMAGVILGVCYCIWWWFIQEDINDLTERRIDYKCVIVDFVAEMKISRIL